MQVGLEKIEYSVIKKTQDTVSFERLPRELLFQIFSYLKKLSDQKTFSLLNKECNLVAKNFPLYELCLRICKLKFFFPWNVPLNDAEILNMTYSKTEKRSDFTFTSANTEMRVFLSHSEEYENNFPKWVWKEDKAVCALFDNWISIKINTFIQGGKVLYDEAPSYKSNPSILLPSSFHYIFDLERQSWYKNCFYFDQTKKNYYVFSQIDNCAFISKGKAPLSNFPILFSTNQLFPKKRPLLVQEDRDQFSLLLYEKIEQTLEVFTQKKTEKKEEQVKIFSEKFADIRSLYHGSSFSFYVALKERFLNEKNHYDYKIHLLDIEKTKLMTTISSPHMKDFTITNVLVKPKEKAIIIFYTDGFEVYDFSGSLFSKKFNIQFTSPVLDERKILYFYNKAPFHPKDNKEPGRLYQWNLSDSLNPNPIDPMVIE